MIPVDPNNVVSYLRHRFAQQLPSLLGVRMSIRFSEQSVSCVDLCADPRPHESNDGENLERD